MEGLRKDINSKCLMYIYIYMSFINFSTTIHTNDESQPQMLSLRGVRLHFLFCMMKGGKSLHVKPAKHSS